MLLHISFGLITALFAHRWFGVEMSWWLCLIGIASALLPDIDALPELWKNGRVAAHSGNVHDHCNGLHYPTITTPSVFAIVAVAIYTHTYIESGAGNWSQVWFWASFIAGNVFIHFILDSFGPGWGVRWTFVPHKPNTWSNYKFFCDRDNTPSWHFLTSWRHDEIKQVMSMHGDKDWLKKYFQSTGFLLEYIILMLTIAAVLAAFSNASLNERGVFSYLVLCIFHYFLPNLHPEFAEMIQTVSVWSPAPVRITPRILNEFLPNTFDKLLFYIRVLHNFCVKNFFHDTKFHIIPAGSVFVPIIHSKSKCLMSRTGCANFFFHCFVFKLFSLICLFRCGPQFSLPFQRECRKIRERIKLVFVKENLFFSVVTVHEPSITKNVVYFFFPFCPVIAAFINSEKIGCGESGRARNSG